MVSRPDTAKRIAALQEEYDGATDHRQQEIAAIIQRLTNGEKRK
jgi:hypothetical protein